MASTGVNFSYPEGIGWGNADHPDLARIFAAVDGQITTVKSLITVLNNRIAAPVVDVAALKALDTTTATTWPDKIACYVEGEDAFFFLDRDSAAAEVLGPPVEVVEPTAGVGRWLRTAATISTNDIKDLAVTVAKCAAATLAAANHTVADTAGNFPSTMRTVEAALAQAGQFLGVILSEVDLDGAPPVGPAIGDKHIQDGTAGVFTDQYVYTWDGTGWIETIPAAGMTAYLVPDAALIAWNGAAGEWDAGVYASRISVGQFTNRTGAPSVEGSLVRLQPIVLGGVALAEVSDAYVFGADAVNTDGGVAYGNLSDAAGTRTVNLYSDVARTVLVATGDHVGDGTITLAAVGGSGLTGYITVAYVAGGDFEVTVPLDDFAVVLADATADTQDDVIGTVIQGAIADGAEMLVNRGGEDAQVLLEDATPVGVGRLLYLSAAVPGRATTTPGVGTLIGIATVNRDGGIDQQVTMIPKFG